jgi:thioredoxin reductase (NADPH)
VLVEPSARCWSNTELATKLGLQTRPDCSFYDVVIVGGGPAGLTAAVYASRDGLDTLVIEAGGFGGQAAVTDRLENYPGFPECITGAEFADRLTARARRYCVELLTVEVASIEVDGQYRVIQSASGEAVRSYAVLVAPGSTYRRLDVPGKADFIGGGRPLLRHLRRTVPLRPGRASGWWWQQCDRRVRRLRRRIDNPVVYAAMPSW